MSAAVGIVYSVSGVIATPSHPRGSSVTGFTATPGSWMTVFLLLGGTFLFFFSASGAIRGSVGAGGIIWPPSGNCGWAALLKSSIVSLAICDPDPGNTITLPVGSVSIPGPKIGTPFWYSCSINLPGSARTGVVGAMPSGSGTSGVMRDGVIRPVSGGVRGMSGNWKSSPTGRGWNRGTSIAPSTPSIVICGISTPRKPGCHSPASNGT